MTQPSKFATMVEIRREIDHVDEELIKLLAERLALVENAIAVKRRAGIAARVPERIDEVIANVRRFAAAQRVDPALAEATWTAMIEWLIAYEERFLKSE